MVRTDLSYDLIHWIKGESNEEAFDVMRSIVREQCIRGGTGHIKGGYQCVCFTEAPQNTFHDIIRRYRPFGIRVSKKWLYNEGGRPVIYQAEDEYDALPESHRWRHVRYEPGANPPVDFTWEREWRINADSLPLPPGEARLVLPKADWAAGLEAEHLEEEDYRIQLQSVAYGDAYLMEDPEPFRYAYSIVNI